jgi:hypothetical protein
MEGEPQTLSLKLCNLRSPTDPGGDSAGSTSQRSELCLARVVFDTRNLYAAFGSLPPLYVLPGVSSANVLLLATGDLRSALYSLVGDARRRLFVSFFVDDVDPHMLARNIVLLWLAHHAPPAHVFAVRFSLGLSASAHASLHQALDALTGPSCANHLAEIGVGFWRPEDRSRIGDVLCESKQMRLQWPRVQTQRRELFRRSQIPNMDFMRPGFAPLRLSGLSMSEPHIDALREELEKEMAAYIRMGLVIPLGE